MHGRRLMQGVGALLLSQAALLMVALAAQAAEPAPLRAAAAPTAPDELAAAVHQLNMPKPRKFTLRCWQHGRLIIERLVDRIPASAGDVVRLGEADARGVALFERRGSICMVE